MRFIHSISKLGTKLVLGTEDSEMSWSLPSQSSLCSEVGSQLLVTVTLAKREVVLQGLQQGLRLRAKQASSPFLPTYI